jgi:hypothetical protein
MAYIFDSDSENYCPECDDYLTCSGVACAEHPTVCLFKTDQITAELDRALYNGQFWGDILYIEEQDRLSKRTDEEVKNEEAKKDAEDARQKASLRAYVLDKTRRHHCEQNNGKWVLKHKFNVKCTDFHLAGGCWAHEEGICRFIHPGEEEKFNFNGAKVIKLISGEPPRAFKTSNVSWLTSKAPLQKVSKIQDAW